MRGDQEIVVVVRRGPEFLVMRRAPERLGYWSLVAGGLEPDETPTEAAQRELFEETRARVEGATAARSRSRTRCSTTLRPSGPVTHPGSRRSPSTPSSSDAPVKWEPTLDAEHDRYRWCDLDEALALLVYDTTKDAVRAAARELR